MRTVIVGDIHGCINEWEKLLGAVSFDRTADQLILLGDLMDRGPNSYGVYCKAVSLQEQMQERFVLIKGSHERFLLDDHLSIPHRLLWPLIGKREAVRSFNQQGRSMDESIPWFKKHCTLYYEADTFQCVHAGVKSEVLSENDEYTLLMDHRCARQNRYTGKLTITGHVVSKEPMYYDGSGKKGQMLPYNQRMPLPETGCICIDTGCAEGNKLTAMLIEGEEYYLVSVSAGK